MPPANTNSRGESLAQRLSDAVKAVGRIAGPGSRELPVLRGVTPQGLFTAPLENVLAKAREILVASGRIYQYGGSIVMTGDDDHTSQLVVLRRGLVPEPIAKSLLANLFICEVQ